jgi:hypothetical protein
MFYRIIADDKVFHLSHYTIDKYPESLLYKLVNDNDTSNHAFFDKSANTITLDMDPNSVKVVIDYLRNYSINGLELQKKNLADKVQRDSLILNLKDLSNLVQDYLPIMNSYFTQQMVTKLINCILEFSIYILNKYNPFGTWKNKHEHEIRKIAKTYFASNEGKKLMEVLVDKYVKTNSMSPEISLLATLSNIIYNISSETKETSDNVKKFFSDKSNNTSSNSTSSNNTASNNTASNNTASDETLSNETLSIDSLPDNILSDSEDTENYQSINEVSYVNEYVKIG